MPRDSMAVMRLTVTFISAVVGHEASVQLRGEGKSRTTVLCLKLYIHGASLHGIVAASFACKCKAWSRAP